MKFKALPILVLMSLMVVSAKATIWTVDNKPESPAHFKDLQAAIDSAVVADGDTLYVSGSQNNYGVIVLNKRLVLIGAGYNPNSEQLKTQVNRIELEYIIESNYAGDDTISSPANSHIMGFDFTYGINSQDGIGNIHLERCHVQSIDIKGHSWVVKNNIHQGNININDDVTNTLILNNIMLARINGACYSVTIKNNLFFKNAFSNVNNSLISNNIFLERTDGVSNSTFRNNLSYGSADYTFDYGDNTASNNIVNQDPLFVQAESTEWDWENDFHLAEASPGHQAGTDGKNVGIYGGTHPFPQSGDELYSGMPSIPQIIEMEVINNILPPGGELKIQVKARHQE